MGGIYGLLLDSREPVLVHVTKRQGTCGEGQVDGPTDLQNFCSAHIWLQYSEATFSIRSRDSRLRKGKG